MISEYLRWRRAQKKIRQLQKMPSDAIVKNFVLDCHLGESQQLATLLGLTVDSDDIAQSAERRKRYTHLVPVLSFLSTVLSSSVMTYYDTVASDETSLSPEEQVAMQQWVSKVALSFTLGALSSLESLDLLKVMR